ncbi:hypothetical protein AVEN_51589-1 [Araneus ventricosus]|uniref:Uncharacterized protein n=1 Tax=Araneus ventricosus TaxID=182803 RepID=A0A4Y2LFG6_ARAVE|nr:hypothetical protein AVEN_51589-1 [Araneus ventricosus]
MLPALMFSHERISTFSFNHQEPPSLVVIKKTFASMAAEAESDHNAEINICQRMHLDRLSLGRLAVLFHVTCIAPQQVRNSGAIHGRD